jgi:ATP-dependent helicase/nuclease subunit B
VSISPDLLAAAEAGQTILAPNAELAAALFDAIERAQREAGRELWSTPKVRDFGSWAREQYALRHAAEESLPRQLSDIEDRELWRQVIDASDAAHELLDIGVAARAARRARRTVLEYAIPWRRLEAEATDETGIFLNWNRAFEARCRELDCVGAEVRLQDLGPPSETPMWIDSPAWRPAARHWLRQHARSIAPEPGLQARTTVLHARAPGRELAAVAGWMHERLSANARFRAWIFVPALAHRRAEIEDAFDARLELRRFGMPGDSRAACYAVAGGTPLSKYAPVRAALQLLQASIGAVTFLQFSCLLRAPELQGSERDASAAARIDLALRRYGPHESNLAGWLRLADELARQGGLSAPTAVIRLRAALLALEAVQPTNRMSEWIGAWVRALNAGPWSMRQRWSSVEFQAAQRFRELLAALAGAETFFGRQPRDAAQRILARSANETAFQPQTGIPPIWISGQPMDPWLQYDAVWLCGMSEAQWPPAVEPVAMLPVALQRCFGVVAADADSQLAMARELLGRWQQRGEQCIFSYSDTTEGRAALPSPLLPRAVGSFAVPEALAQPHWRALKVQAPAMQKFIDARAPPFSQEERTRGVATLRAQSRCAFRGFAEIRLAAERLEQPVPGFNDRERGELVHHALQEIWSELGNSDALRALEPQAQHELLQRVVSGAVQAVSRRRDPGPRWRQRERKRLGDLLGKWLDVERGREAFVVESLEGEAQIARFAGLELKVRLDRVDRLADGTRVLIDYKTGSAAVDWRGDRPDNPQLPIYALLKPQALVAVAYGKVNAADPGFLAETERRNVFKPGGKATLLEEQSSLAALIEIWSRRVEVLAAAFAAGHAEVAPTAVACRSCALQGLCRVPTVLQESDQ